MKVLFTCIVLNMCISAIVLLVYININRSHKGAYEYTFAEWDYDSRPWEGTEYDGSDCVPDKETAVAIVDIIMNARFAVYRPGRTMSSWVQYVYFDPLDEVWIVVYGDYEPGTVVESNVYVAISKKNGKIISTW